MACSLGDEHISERTHSHTLGLKQTDAGSSAALATARLYARTGDCCDDTINRNATNATSAKICNKQPPLTIESNTERRTQVSGECGAAISATVLTSAVASGGGGST